MFGAVSTTCQMYKMLLPILFSWLCDFFQVEGPYKCLLTKDHKSSLLNDLFVRMDKTLQYSTETIHKGTDTILMGRTCN